MACFSISLLVQVIVWLIIVGALVAILQIWLPQIVGALGAWGGMIAATLRIILGAVIAIFIVYLLYDLITCAFYGGRPLLR
jgi:hypothetical protein